MFSRIVEMFDPDIIGFGLEVGSFVLNTKKDLGDRLLSLADQTGNAYYFIVDVYPKTGKIFFTFL
ncbi:hypothetical protein ISU91_17780 [Leptospira borgpetersenii serovar Hardjo-bovis]|nr:hypothetical protein [Leptospira borgpetersenii serovar Hardjo-bovis]